MSAQANVDPAEIDKFQSIASRWWDRESEFKPLHDINPLRVSYIEQQVDGLSGKKILDVGCGGGILAEALASRGADVTGIDMADKSLAVARMHLHESGLSVDYQHVAVESFADDHPAQFDVVTCLEMLEHVPDPGSIIAACSRLLKPDGHLLLSTINRNPAAFALAILGAEYLLRMLPRGTHDYERFIKPSEIAKQLRGVEMHPVDITGMSYNPVTEHYSLGRDIKVNYLMTARFND